jgi:hypothetical protein
MVSVPQEYVGLPECADTLGSVEWNEYLGNLVCQSQGKDSYGECGEV